MKLYEFISQNEEEIFRFPEEPDIEDYEVCRMIPRGEYWDYAEETYTDEEAYEDDLRAWEEECERIRNEYEFSESTDLYLMVNGECIEEFEEIRTYLDSEIEKTEGLRVWIA